MTHSFRNLEINGGRVSQNTVWRLGLDPDRNGYADAQFDDYGGRKRSGYPWRPGTRMKLQARFSHPNGQLVGTTGFGFWNAPFGDPTVPRPALPQAIWFFYASEPSDLPFPEQGPGRGWFAGTMDASTGSAMLLAPLALPTVVLNNVQFLRRRIWPAVRRRLNISYRPVLCEMTEWHRYVIEWLHDGCRFWVDDLLLLETGRRPQGPLGFVCWLDNQYMIATPTGRLRWGTRQYSEAQWLEVKDLRLEKTIGGF